MLFFLYILGIVSVWACAYTAWRMGEDITAGVLAVALVLSLIPIVNLVFSIAALLVYLKESGFWSRVVIRGRAK